MRFRVWGISLVPLLLTAVLPLVFWTFFRWNEQPEVVLGSVFRLYRSSLVWSLPLYFTFSVTWIYLVKRGLFSARFSVYALYLLALVYEFFSAVMDRSFSRLGLGLLMFGSLIAIYRWLEQKIGSAAMNPRISWYEGDAKTLPHLQARVKIQDEWIEAAVRLIDGQGLFLFLQNWTRPANEIRQKGTMSFELEFRGQKVDGEGSLVSIFAAHQKPGIGLQFLAKDLYHFSQYTALVESLKGEGYVE
jgi:hypothetical protein